MRNSPVPALPARGIGFGLAALTAASLILLDPWVTALLPDGLWRRLGMEDWPLQASVLMLPGGLILLATLRAAFAIRGIEGPFFVASFAAAQMNGLGVGPLDVFDFVFFGCLALWLARIALDENRPVEVPPLILTGGLLLLLAVPHLLVQSPLRWTLGLFGMFRAVAVAFLVVNLCRTPERLAFVARVFVAVAVASGGFAILQFFFAYFGILQFTLLEPPESAFKPTPLGMVMRASGLCITAQHLSSFLVFATPFALWRLTETWRARDIVVILVLWTGILVSWNYGAIFAAALIGVVFTLLRWPALVLHTLVLGCTILVAAYFSGLLQLAWDLSFGDAGVAKGVDQRKTLFALGLEQMDRNPLVGVGLQGFAEVSGNFWHRPVHNAFGQAATELGMFGAVVLLAAILTVLTQLILLACRVGGAGQREAKIMILVIVAMLALMMSEPNLDHINTWLMLGVAQATVTIAEAGRRRGLLPGVA